MTYCVGLTLDEGLVYIADTRTNAGVDDISTFRKLHAVDTPGERSMTLLSSGNLATTQMVINILKDRMKSCSNRDAHLMNASSMFEAAKIVGTTLRNVINTFSENERSTEKKFDGTMILGGQIIGDEPRLFLIYPEGNFIEASIDTPYFQIGETKYGRPILIRAYNRQMGFEDAVKLLLVSFDSTIKANLSVGLPLDLQIYKRGSFCTGMQFRIEKDNEYFNMISSGWGEALRNAFDRLPDFSFETSIDPNLAKIQSRAA
ncbi:MAG: peptidase [Albidovulum sp.]|nr:peptidase [Albidovulum sp.]MDE0532195.1 peptidase [Albidovulum sp.]